jgi:peptidoglycan/LPS O-acetylase OafA/YrhL
MILDTKSPKIERSQTDKNHVMVIDALRGIAALMVVIVHGSAELDKSWLTVVAGYGQYGVVIFFVISGFIIPYSLDQYFGQF